jgi:hypothetical protein
MGEIMAVKASCASLRPKLSRGTMKMHRSHDQSTLIREFGDKLLEFH